MDDDLRYWQRQYEQGQINVLQWLTVLRRANQPYHSLLISAWTEILTVIPPHRHQRNTLPLQEEYFRLIQAVALLGEFPLQCTCRICFTVCQCMVTGICGPDTRTLCGHPLKFTETVGCLRCEEKGCSADFGDKFWVKPGTLAVVIEDPKMGAYSSRLERAYPTCRGHHYRGPGDYESDIEYCRGDTQEKLNYILRHAACRYEPYVEELDENQETWRDILSGLRPGELPPY